MHLQLLLLDVLVFLLCSVDKHDAAKIGAIFDWNHKQRTVAFEHAVDQLQMLYKTPIQAVSISMDEENPYEAIKAACSLLSDGVLGILGPTFPENSNAVRFISDMKEVPLIDYYPDYEIRMGTNINIHPDPNVLNSIYVEILQSLKWKIFIILYENLDSLLRMQQILKMRDYKEFKIVVKQLDNGSTRNYRPILKEVWRSDSKNILIDCAIEILPDVLEQAQQIGLITDEYSYFITNLDFHTVNISSYKYSETNITGIKLFDSEREDAKAIHRSLDEIEDFDSEEQTAATVDSALIWDVLFMFMEAVNEMNRSWMWMPLRIDCNSTDSRESGQSIINIMKLNTLKGLTGNIQFDQVTKRSDFELDVIELREEGFTPIGNWSKNGKLRIQRPPHPKNGDANSLEYMHFTVITSLIEPYTMYKPDINQLYGNDRFEGFAIDIITELANLLHFKYTFIIRDDMANGSKDNATGKWSGMIGDVIDHVADLAIADLTITSERQEAVDFTPDFMTLGISILYEKPKKGQPSFFSFFDPFAKGVWFSISASFFGCSVALYIIGRLCPSEWNNPYPCIEEPEFYVNQFSIPNAFWFIMGSIMQQGSEIAPVAVSTRLVAGVWWFFTLIMVSSYTANLAACLTTEQTEPAFENIKELVKGVRNGKLHITYGTKKNGSTANFFRDSYEPLYQEVYRYMMDHYNEVMVDNPTDGVIKAVKGDYAFFMESVSIEYEIQRKCNLTSYGGKLDEKGYGIAMRKESWYRHQLSSAMLKLLEQGKIEELRKKWWEEQREGGKCVSDGEPDAATPLNLRNVGGIFGVTLAGLIFALLLGLCEMLTQARRRARKLNSPYKDSLGHDVKFYLKFQNTKPTPSTPGTGSEESSKRRF